jgi:hypothetical protein
VVLALAGACGAAASQDPLKSAECAGALASLQAAREHNPAQVEPLRQAAALACLGTAAAPGRPAREARPPTAVAPTGTVPPTPVPGVRMPPAVPPPPPVAIERPLLPGHCDASGCWASDGTRLRHIGPAPTVPGAPCALLGGVVACP